MAASARTAQLKAMAGTVTAQVPETCPYSGTGLG